MTILVCAGCGRPASHSIRALDRECLTCPTCEPALRDRVVGEVVAMIDASRATTLTAITHAPSTAVPMGHHAGYIELDRGEQTDDLRATLVASAATIAGTVILGWIIVLVARWVLRGG